jgi:hypothetical protein
MVPGIDSRKETYAGALRIAMIVSFELAACDSSTGHAVSIQDAGTNTARTDTGASDSSDFGSVVGDASADHAPTSPELPARPPWKPDLPMGAPGWRNSIVPFCSEDGNYLTPLVWSTGGRVYVDVRSECGGEDYCGVHEILYTNDGSGWRRIYGESDSSSTGITGFADGRVVLLGNTNCSVKQIDPSGNATCLWAEPWPNWTFWPITAAVTGTDLLVLGNYVDTNTVELRKYDGTQWTSLKTWADPTIGSLAVSGTTAIVAAYQAWDVDLALGTTTLVPNVPAAGYNAVWTYGPTDILLGNYAGGLAHYDGSQWTTLNTMFNDAISGMWGAPDGTVFMHSQGNFARRSAGSFEPIVMQDVFASSAPWLFVDMWGNSSAEVFLAVNDLEFGSYKCGSLFMLWFDGTNFHQF